MGLLDVFFGGPKPTLKSIHFSTNGFQDRGELMPGQVHGYFTPDGDGAGVYFFAIKPDLPQNASLDGLAQFYRSQLKGVNGRLLDLEWATISGHTAIAMVIAVPQQPSGLAYVASLTLPFRDCSFVLKCQCEEHSPTGMRETILLDRALAKDINAKPTDQNFYDKQYDAEFPAHPLSRARRTINHFVKTAKLDEAVQKLAAFNFRR